MFDWLRNRSNTPNDSTGPGSDPANPAPGRAPANVTRPIASSMDQFSQAVVQSLPINLMPQPRAGAQAPVIRQWSDNASAATASPPASPPAAPPAPNGAHGAVRLWNDPTQKQHGHTLPIPGPRLDEPQGSARVWRPSAPTAAPSTSGAASDDAIELAQQILRNQQLSAQLPAEILVALRGLVAPSPTPQQVKDGLEALAVTLTALQAAHQDALAQSLPTLLREWYMTPSWPASREWLTSRLHQLPFDAPEQFDDLARRVRGNGDTHGADLLELHAKLIREARRVGADSAYRALVGAKAFERQSVPASAPQQQPHVAHIDSWLRTPTWAESRQYLAAHQRELLVDATEMALRLLYEPQTDQRAKEQVELHQRIISAARRSGVDAAYRAVIGDAAFQTSGPTAGGAGGAGRAGVLSGGASGPVTDAEDLVTLEQARDIAQTTLNDPNLARALAPVLRADLEGLLSPYASQDQISRGKRAAVFIAVVEGTARVRELLVDWMNTPNWRLSYEYLKARQAQLLTDEAEVGLRVLLAAESDATNRKTIGDHQRLLEECRRVGVNAAYAPLLGGAWA